LEFATKTTPSRKWLQREAYNSLTRLLIFPSPLLSTLPSTSIANMPTMAMNLEAREALSTLILAITKTGDLYLDPGQVKVRAFLLLLKIQERWGSFN
jgi:hypothetical protein